MPFILAILINPILFIADEKVTNKFKRSFGIEHKCFSTKRLRCVGILLITMWSLFSVPICKEIKN